LSETSITVTDPNRLLEPPTDAQQRLIELAGSAFAEDGDCPIYQYIVWRLDEERIDALEVLNSFPALAGRYYSIHCPRGPLSEPGSAMKVALTVLGIHHCEALRREPPLETAYYRAVDYLAQRLRLDPVPRNRPRDVLVNARDLISAVADHRIPRDRLSFNFLWELMAGEPPTPGAYTAPGGPWTWKVDRPVRAFEGIAGIEDYLERLTVLLLPPVAAPPPAVPNPLELVTELDYLDAIWRLIPSHQREHLFTFEGGERTAKLSWPANSPEEFDSRLSSLGELLRSANESARNNRRKEANREWPLKDLAKEVGRLLQDNAVAARAVATLTDVVRVRDAGQHGDAHARGVAAAARFGFEYPPRNPTQAWETVAQETITALVALREELQPLSR
jgi:hypothetical protein